MTFRNKPRSSNGRRIHLLPMSARGIFGSTHSLPSTFSRDSECSLATRRVDEDCGHVLEASPLRSIAGIGHGGSVRHDNRGRAGQSGRSIRRRTACSTRWWADRRAFIGGTANGGSARIRLNYSGGSSVFICSGLGLHGAHRCKAGQDMSSQPPATGSLRWSGISHRTLMAWRLLSAIMLLVMGGIHLYLVF